MAQAYYKVFDENVEVHGQPMQTFVECITKESVSPVLKELGVETIDVEHWYPQQLWLDIFNELRDRKLVIGTFVDIGMRTIELTRYPEEVKSIPFKDFMLHGADRTHQHNHRGGDAGEYTLRLEADNHIVVDARVPYPDDFVYGCYYQLTMQFRPEGVGFYLEYDKELPKREDGGEFTRIHIKLDSPAT